MQMVGLSQLGWQEHVCTWHFASIRCAAKFGRFQTIADIPEFWHEMARSRLTQSGQAAIDFYVAG
jgi:hypothetical protein